MASRLAVTLRALLVAAAVLCAAGVARAQQPPPVADPQTSAAEPDISAVPPPPERWQEFAVEGDLLESRETVEAFLRPRMERARVLNDTARNELETFIREELGYALLEIRKERQPGGAIRAVLVLEPMLMVYTVKVDIDTFTSLRGFFETIFGDQIRRRMRLRQGSRLPRNLQARAQELIKERQRLEEFLQNEGYFDARVRVSAEPHGDHSVIIEVDVDKGTRYQVGEVRVVGAEAIQPEEIAKRFRHPWVCILICILDGGFSREQLTKDVQRVVQMYHRRGYPGARVRTDFDIRHSADRDSRTVEFTVFVNERRRVDVVFLGNDKKKRPDDTLRKQLTFADEGSYDDLEIEASAEAIRRHYQGKGFFEASVTHERLTFGAFERIIFTIDEGPKLPVRNVSFQGNQALSDGQLRSLVKTREFRDVAILGGGGGYVTSVQLAQDVERIRKAYAERGYSQVQVRARVARDPKVQDNAPALAAAVAAQLEASGLFVRFIVEEGPREVVSEVVVEFLEKDPDKVEAGYYGKRETRLRRLMKLEAGDPYHASKAVDDRSRVARTYFQDGYPNAAVEVDIQRPTGDKTQVVVHWKINEHAPVRFGKVAVRGNFHTADWVIMDELGFEEGDLMTLVRAERAQQNLRTSGLFRTVRVEYPDLGDDDNLEVANAVVSVQERERILFEAGGGYSTDSELFAEAALTHRNLFGIGIRPEFRGLLGQQEKGAEVKLTFPRWIGRKITAGTMAFHSEATAFVRNETTERFGDLFSVGTSLALSKAGQYGFFRGWVVSLRYDLRLRFRNVDLVRPAGQSGDLETGPVPTVTGSIGPQLVIDKRKDDEDRPNPLSPAQGWLLELHASYADPVFSNPVSLVGESPGRDRFIKLGGSGQVFWKPSKRSLISNGLRYDHGIPLGNEFLLPEVERFFAGGDTTVRGFEEDRLATEIISAPVPPLGAVDQIRILPAGGNIRLIHNLDLQLEVWELLGFPVASALFFDTGLVANSLDGFEPDDLRHSVGLAVFRWTLPVGSLSVEYAVPLDPQLGDDPRGRFHFNLGLLFN